MEDNKIRETNKRGQRERERERARESQTWIKESEEKILQQSSIQPRTKSHNLA